MIDIDILPPSFSLSSDLALSRPLEHRHGGECSGGGDGDGDGGGDSDGSGGKGRGCGGEGGGGSGSDGGGSTDNGQQGKEGASPYLCVLLFYQIRHETRTNRTGRGGVMRGGSSGKTAPPATRALTRKGGGGIKVITVCASHGTPTLRGSSTRDETDACTIMDFFLEHVTQLIQVVFSGSPFVKSGKSIYRP